MSLDALVWAVKDAPVRDVYERAVLTVMADVADESGCSVFLAVSTIADRCRVSERKVQRVLADLSARALIGSGDQSRTRHIRSDHRPHVWDLLIPHSAFSNVDRVNRARQALGLPELTPASRPDIADPSPRELRADAGVKRGPKGDETGGVSSSHPAPTDGVSSSHPDETDTGCLSRRHGVTTSSSGERLSQQVVATMPASRGDYCAPDPSYPVIDPPTRARVPAREAGAGAVPTQNRGEGIDPDPTQDPRLRALAEQLLASRGWSVASTTRVMTQAMREDSRTVDQVLIVMARVGSDLSSQKPTRMLAVPGDWWLSAIGQVPGSVPKPTWCGHCDPATRRRTHPDTQNDAGRCPACHPLALEGAA